MYLGSDAIALAPFTDTISYLEDGDWAVVTRKGVEVHDANGQVVERAVLKSNASAFLVDKGNHRHFMAKEIHEQPEVVGHTLAHYLDMGNERVSLPMKLPFDFTEDRARGDLGLRHRLLCRPGRQILVRALRAAAGRDRCRLRIPLPRGAVRSPGNLAVFVSQSGETADTLATLRYAKEQKQHVLSIVNVPTSTIARESDVVMPTLAGPEIGVASTKAFTCQLAALLCLAIAAGRARGVLSEEDERKLVRALIEVPRHHVRGAAAGAADRGAGARSRQSQGRALSRPRHGLSDRARRRAEAEGNLLHPRRRLCGGRAQARPDRADRRDHAGGRDRAVRQERPARGVFEKTVSNMQEVAARGGKIILVTDPKGAAEASALSLSTLMLPDMATTVTPLVYAIPVQLIAYHTAVIMGTDVDQPRNLAKSVTVE